MKLGRTLQSLRRAKGFRQADLANQICVSRSTYSGWENDKGCPSFSQVYTLTRILNLSMEVFTKKLEQDQHF